MMTAAMVGFGSGQGATRLKGSTRDIYASIRQARSLALVTQQPAIITYGEKIEDGTVSARITITAAKLMSKGVTKAETLAGDVVLVGDQPEDGDAIEEGEGETMEDVLFESISEDVLSGIRIKVLTEDEDISRFDNREEKRRAKISVFSNVDYLLGRYNEEKSKASAPSDSEQDSSNNAPPEAASDTEAEPDKSFVWETNGRCEPHKVWIYRQGQSPQNGLCISVDRFGGAKVLSAEEAR